MANEITLPVGAAAEPDTCGSCKFFSRRDNGAYYASQGNCAIHLPPQIAQKGWDGEGFGPSGKQDTDRCDLQRPDGKVYIMQRKVGP